MSIKGKSHGRRYWRSLDQLAETPQYKEFLNREFPEGTTQMSEGEGDNAWSRRSFLTLMGASMALAGLAACRKPVEKIIPFVDRPEGQTPGTPLSYATTMPMGNSALGMLVTSNDGRPTKVEGNPMHPSSHGAASVVMQASILNLYDPDRSQAVLQGKNESDWPAFVSFWLDHLENNHSRGEGLAVLSEAFSSPTMWRLREAFLKKYPRARWVGYESISDENRYRGIEIALGGRYQPLYDFSGVKTIVSLDADFVGSETDSLRHAATFADGRRVLSETDEMSRLYVIESSFSITGGMADHRLRLPSSQVAGFALAFAGHLKTLGLKIDSLSGLTARPGAAYKMEWVALLAEELISNKGRSLIIAGRNQPPAVHALVCALNSALGNVGKSVRYVKPKDSLYSSDDDLAALVNDMNSGSVKTLLMIGGNPVYNGPSDIAFGEALSKVPTSVHLSSHNDETSALSSWHLNRAHFLESWGDARGLDGTASVIQPLIKPLHGGISDVDMAILLATGSASSGYDAVRQTWVKLTKKPFDNQWRRLLHDGLLAGSASKSETPKVQAAPVRSAVNGHKYGPAPTGGSDLELSFYLSNPHDGRFANNAWLQELPDPVTKLAWDNAALLSVATAKKLSVKNEDMVRISVGGREITLPVWISPGQADNCVAVALGYGRSEAGENGSGVGVNAFPLRISGNGDFRSGASLTPTGETYPLANTQDHGTMMGRPIVREATLAAYQKGEGNETFEPQQIKHPPLLALWNEHSYEKGPQWGMTIDLNSCNGCNACVIACQSENNIPVVGKEQVRLGREMHWIRLDRYYTGDKLGDGNDPTSKIEVDDVEMVIQPVTCMHCENAPCETVCPVGATVHDDEGLNVMVYNRCIGTRYCSNNCPYKVRRFNYFNLTKDLPELERMAQNPEVTVRSRGVMEKCTFCTQRIEAGKNTAKLAGRPLADDDIVPACAQSCPTKAIIFGDIRDENSRVSKMKKVNRNYNLLEELFTKPRTSYLARLRNPNPEMKG